MAKERNIITFELRADKDDDIAKALEQATTKENSQSSVIRTALRQYLLRGESIPTKIERTSIEAPELNIQLQEIEKDDIQLDDALDDLLKF